MTCFALKLVQLLMWTFNWKLYIGYMFLLLRVMLCLLGSWIHGWNISSYHRFSLSFSKSVVYLMNCWLFQNQCLNKLFCTNLCFGCLIATLFQYVNILVSQKTKISFNLKVKGLFHRREPRSVCTILSLGEKYGDSGPWRNPMSFRKLII